MKIAMGLRRYETMIPHQEEGVVDNRVDDHTCVLTIRTLEGALLGWSVVPNDSEPCHVVAALEGAIQDPQRSCVHWLVVDNASATLCSVAHRSFPGLQGVALDTCHMPMKYEAVASNHKQVLRRLVSKFNVELLQGSPPDLDHVPERTEEQEFT